jgi:hypothetical protein
MQRRETQPRSSCDRGDGDCAHRRQSEHVSKGDSGIGDGAAVGAQVGPPRGPSSGGAASRAESGLGTDSMPESGGRLSQTNTQGGLRVRSRTLNLGARAPPDSGTVRRLRFDRLASPQSQESSSPAVPQEGLSDPSLEWLLEAPTWLREAQQQVEALEAGPMAAPSALPQTDESARAGSERVDTFFAAAQATCQAVPPVPVAITSSATEGGPAEPRLGRHLFARRVAWLAVNLRLQAPPVTAQSAAAAAVQWQWRRWQ